MGVGGVLRWTVAVAAVAAGALVAVALDRCFPLPAAARAPADGGVLVTAADGSPLRAYPGADGVWRYPVSPEEVSPLYLQALLTFEDRWFAWHPGVNPAALARAAWQWLTAGRIVSGGSTLTMQVARMVDPALRAEPRSVPAKLRQILRALQLEWHLSKRQILTLYLNHAPMGGIVEGVEMASRSYLGKPASQLSHAEAALLTALPQAPSRLRPDRQPAAAARARDKVLQRMAERGVWPAAAVQDARTESIVVQVLKPHWLAPLAAERLRQRAAARDGARHDEAAQGGAVQGGVAQAGAAQAGPAEATAGTAAAAAHANAAGGPSALPVVRSTIDPELQSVVENMLMDRIGTLPPHVSMAVLVMDNDSLEARAYAGSADFFDARRASQVDMIQAVRSPGSTLKPFLYAMALDAGLVHSESLLADAPQSFGGYRPGNFQAAFSGPVSVAEALRRSLNVPAVDLLDRIGPVAFAAQLRAGGVRLRTGGAPPNLSLILGGAGTTLEELVGAYRALARGGMAGRLRLTPSDPRIESRLMSPGAAFIIRDILETGGDPGRSFDASRRGLAWKTGTSFGFRDAWAIGVTGTWTLGVWVGRPDGTPNPGFFGANVAAPLLQDLAAALPAPAPAPRVPPPSVRPLAICWPLGLRAAVTPSGLCLQQRLAWVLDDAAPPTLPDRDVPGGQTETVWIDPASGRRTAPGCPVPGRATQTARWPLVLQPWVEAGLLRGAQLPPWHPACAPALRNGPAAVRLEGLETGAVLRPVPGRARIDVQLRALGAEGALWWMLDGRPVRRAQAGRAIDVSFTENGLHTVTAMDEAGRYDSVRVTVRGLR
ncbi:hypothetical protein GCM10023144_38170 [Pigmentiphaga soli]|uniref:peptidoglycan glycosyltransferase n=2 Tax=Pigmentiphaga soli TaxID=1007095 RepID=A0ABP8HI79_9BURK